MLTSSLTQFIRRIGVCALSFAMGVSTAIVLLLLVSSPPAHAQAAAGPHPAPITARAESLPTGASAQWQAAVKEQLAKEGGVGAASFTPSSVLTLTDAITGSSFGASVGSAGDVNGDGYLDAIVGASSYLSGTGRVYLYLGSASGLNTTPAFTATGEGTSNRFGFPVGAAGDVNGDGYADVIIGANGYLNNTGRAYVYLGSMNGLSATPAFTVTGDAPANYFGTSVGAAGDVNNDGYDDIIIGAFNYSNGAGRAYVYLGSATGLSSTPAFTATGEGTNNFLGNSAHTAGDVNNDGFDDVVIGAYGYLTNTGKAYLYLGSAVGLNAAPDFTITGEATNTLFGWSVGTAGDVNADTYSDVIVSAPSGEGRFYVYLGSAIGLSPTPVFTDFGNIEPNMAFGIAVATAGDMNGDGYDDVVVGGLQFTLSKIWAYVYLGTGDGRGLIPAPIFDTGQQSGYTSAESFIGTLGDMNGDGYADIIMGVAGAITGTGQAYVYYGAAYTPPWMVTGDRAGSQLGYSVATAGDVNGDSYADVIIGAPGGSPTDTGRIFLYTGSAVGLSLTPTSVLTGGVGDHFGWSAGTAGDVNRDGYADIIVGAWSYNNSTGQAYVYLGSPTGLSATPAFTATGETTNSLFGFSVGTAGDVNKDSYSDVIIGASGYNNMQGRAYVYLGSASSLSATPVFTATGENVGDGLGNSVGTAGDVNGDGYADIGIGAPRFANYNGRAYIYLGNASGLDAATAFTATGTRGSGFGMPVATAGDVNGDSYADIVIGEGNTTTIGYAYVYLGAASGVSATPAFTRTDNVPYSYFGVSAGTAGDVNGDNYDDVIVGAIYHGRGEAYIYLGGAEGLSVVPALTVDGMPLSGLFGWSAGTAGDVNKDGYADVGIGDFGYQSIYQCCVDGRGRAFLYPGGPDGADLRVTKAVTPTTAPPGQAITYTLTFSNAGIVTATNIVITDLMPVGQVGNLSYTSSGAVITPTSGITYSWQAADLAPGAGGVITITGVLSPEVSAGVLTNTATITTTSRETMLADNRSVAAITIVSNTPPAADNDAYTVTENLSLTVAAPGVLANDTDNDGPGSLTAINVTNPLTGSLTFNPDGSFTYTPTLNFTGVVTFTYQANDGLANSNPATVTITVTPVNDVPVATNDAYTVIENLSLTVAAPGVLANDTDTDGPASLTALIVTNPLTGSLTFNPDGSFVYTPTLNFTGMVTFTYQANDGLANSNLATVTITVAAAPGSKLYLPLITK